MTDLNKEALEKAAEQLRGIRTITDPDLIVKAVISAYLAAAPAPAGEADQADLLSRLDYLHAEMKRDAGEFGLTPEQVDEGTIYSEAAAEVCAQAARIAALEAERDEVVKALEPFACKCEGRCESMEWLPSDTSQCASNRARAALSRTRTEDKA